MNGVRVGRRAVIGGAAMAALTGFHPGRRATAQPEAAPTWTRLADGPSPRWDHTLTADGVADRLVLFGGRDGAGAPLGDVWLYDPGNDAWQPLVGLGPSPRFGHATAADIAARRLYLFGGQADGATFFDDAWVLDLDALTWSAIAAGAPGPSARYGTSAVLDGGGRLIASHGFTFDGRFDDTWALDPNSGRWSDLSPSPETRPLKRCLHEAIWDESGARMLLYGGCSSGVGPCPQGDLWAFDPAVGAWQELTPASGPTARSNPALVATPAGASAFLIGGLTENGYAADAWTVAAGGGGAATWSPTALPPGDIPTPRASHDAAILGGRLYLFGGYGADGATDDLWAASLG